MIQRFRNDTYPIYADLYINNEAIDLTNKYIKLSISTVSPNSIIGTMIPSVRGRVRFDILPQHVTETGTFEYDIQATDTITGVIATHIKASFTLIEDITI